MEPRYDINEVEARIEKKWEDSGLFNPDICIKNGVTSPDAEPFSIVLPPPNVTGTLHMGHAAMLAIEDIMVRYARMQGKRTLWIPGADHAAIATQSKVEKDILKKEGKNRHDLGREEFLKRVNAFAQESHNTIVHQTKRMGASLDWSREAYTLDKQREVAVRTAFKKMFDLGLIYCGNRVVNWDPKGQTTISDDEIVYEERKAKLVTFRYDKNFPIAISTTRVETKFGDTAVAVHPNDPRYKEFVDKEYDADFCGTKIHVKIIADEAVEKDFGTGALGVTPAHSMIDWEMAQRHDLPLKQIIDERGKMTIENELVFGKKATEAREIITEELRKRGLIEKEEEISQNVATAERTGGIIEPLPKLQWFIEVNRKFKVENGRLKGQEKTLKELMKSAVADGDVKILPERFERIYFNWIDNLRDWCISRQIWFGHQIPVWTKGEEIYVGVEAPQGDGWIQDPDTLDTWFSSGLWPFSTLGWPQFAEKATKGIPGPENDLANYFPNSVLETGYDIIFFWVARMILMSTCLMGEVPFRKVYLHGLVRDDKGRKMSKSLGNIIDPLTMADKYGADATRLSLVIGAAPGNDVKLSEDRVRGYRNFSTKIWNIARFIEMNKVVIPSVVPVQTGIQVSSEAHKKYVADLETLKKEISTHLDNFEFHLAADKLYHYVWHELADVIIETEKEKLRNGTDKEKAASYAVLEELLLGSLKMLHPFMPFITEEIYHIFRPGKMLMVEKW
jgi:valyl-tRNA synthetase